MLNSEADKNVVKSASGVHGMFSVTHNLRVAHEPLRTNPETNGSDMLKLLDIIIA